MIEITDAAKSKIREILDKNPGKYLRLAVEGDGCAGPYFRVSLDEANSNEKIIRVNGIDILISDQVQRYAEITTINIFVNHMVSSQADHEAQKSTARAIPRPD